MTIPLKQPRPRPRWKVDPSEVPEELRENFVIQYLVNLTPEEEADIAAAEALDAEDDGRPA